MKVYDILVLGAGASGCMAAIKASEKNEKIAIIDKSNKLARKILVTGNGRCNLTNKNVDAKKYNTDINPFLRRFDVKDTLNFFQKIGLITYFDEEGRAYPLSNSAKSVMDVIDNKIKKEKIDCFLEQNVVKVENWKEKFLITTNKDEFLCQKLVIALGGNFSANILDFKDFNFIPSLVSLRTNVSRNLSGCRISDVVVTAKNNNGDKKIERGEILFREKGVSGICIFNISTIFSRRRDFFGEISIDIMPNFSHDELFKLLCQRRTIDQKINKFFDGLLLPQIGYEILNRVKLDENRSSLTLTDKEIESMVKLMKALDYKITGCLDNNQVFSGGIDLEKLTENLEHKKIKNLYFCGEACNVDGECGGYNLQWAWTSGYIVGESL